MSLHTLTGFQLFDVGVSFWVGDDSEFGFGQKLEFIKGIPLTEESVSKLGFTKCLDSWFYSINFDKDQETFKIAVTQSEQFYVFQSKTFIKYVHQLQNIYFVLTGEELVYTI